MALPVNGSTHLIPALLVIYRPRKDERLSWPSWLTCSGRFTHIVLLIDRLYCIDLFSCIAASFFNKLTYLLTYLVVTHQLQVERRTGKVRQSETDVLPLCHATNCSV